MKSYHDWNNLIYNENSGILIQIWHLSKWL